MYVKDQIVDRSELDYCGQLFACKIEHRERDSDLIHIFIGHGNVYVYHYSIAAYWSDDCIELMNFVQKNANCKLKGSF